jgi:hypothetical protein
MAWSLIINGRPLLSRSRCHQRSDPGPSARLMLNTHVRIELNCRCSTHYLHVAFDFMAQRLSGSEVE